MKPVPRAQRVEQIRELKAKGLTWKEIAAELDAKEATLRNAWADPDGVAA